MQEMKSPTNRGSSLLVGLVLIGAVFYVGYHAGTQSAPARITGVENASEGQPESVDFSAFWKAWSILEEKYVPASTSAETVDSQAKVWGAIEGLAASLGDPYTVFFLQ